MGKHQNVKTVTLPAGEDLTGSVGELLTVDANGRVAKADGVTEVVVGVLAESASRSTVGDGVAVALIGGGGVLQVKAGAAITAGHILVPTAVDGKAAGVANIGALLVDQMSFGIALEAATADGQIISFLAQSIAAPHVA